MKVIVKDGYSTLVNNVRYYGGAELDVSDEQYGKEKWKFELAKEKPIYTPTRKLVQDRKVKSSKTVKKDIDEL